MKRVLLTALTLAAGLAVSSASPAAAQAQKIGYINSQQIMAQAPGTTEAQRTFEAEMTRYRTQMDSLEKVLETEQAEFQRQQATLSEAAKTERQQQLQQKFGEYQQRLQQMEQTAQRRQAELVQPIMKRISEVIEQIRTEGSYAMIFDAAAGSLITADPALDLTEQVLARLRAAPAAGQ